MCDPVSATIGAVTAIGGVAKSLKPKFPRTPAPPPPPPPLVERSARSVEPASGLRDAQRLAGRLGTQQLVVPFSNVNVPNA